MLQIDLKHLPTYGDRYLTTEEQADIDRQRANIAQEQVNQLLAKLRSLGVAEE